MGGSIVLVGFMGAGKSTVGRALAERLCFRFYDTDEMVVKKAEMSIAQIFRKEGEEKFRDREHRAVRHACSRPSRVIACGGGAVLQLRNYELLRAAGPIVYLRAPAEVLRARVGKGTGRPLLKTPGAFERLLRERAPGYERACDITVDVSADLTPEAVAELIVERLT
ncbi:MAG: shikimate kinase [Actinomycetota bacterium]